MSSGDISQSVTMAMTARNNVLERNEETETGTTRYFSQNALAASVSPKAEFEVQDDKKAGEKVKIVVDDEKDKVVSDNASAGVTEEVNKA